MIVRAVSPGLVAERARALVERGRDRVLLLRSAPAWAGPPTLDVDGHTVHVQPARSQLAVLAAYADLPEDDYLVVLTDRPDRDLGDAVLVRAANRAVEQPDDWDAVAAMTGAREIDPGLRRLGRWAATALLDLRPEQGWPPASSDVLTAGEAMSWLLATVLGEPADTAWDAVRLVEVLSSRDARQAWAGADDELRRRLTAWATDAVAPHAGLALSAARSSRVSVLAIGLALDVLWPRTDEPDPGRDAARVRIERFVGGDPINPDDARALARDARDIALRMDDAEDPELPAVLNQAERLLVDLQWPAGAGQSDLLLPGLVARLERLAAQVDAHLTGATGTDALERALSAVLDHRLARRERHEVTAARMATRLVRWLSLTHESAATLGESLQQQVDDGGWVDRAVAAVWTGSAFPAVVAAYRRLAERVLRQRGTRDRRAAHQLATATAAGESPAGVVPVERVLSDVVRPLSERVPVLLLVLDGMSTGVATAIAQDATESGWTELLPDGRAARIPGLAVLPTVTTFSRTSLLCGELTPGAQTREKGRFRELTGGPVFHKDDLRTEAGDRLARPVREAIADTKTRVVAAVLNTIDDSLAKEDPDATVWDLDRVGHLRDLLNAAALAGRTVVLTSDHGHVVERGGTARPTAGADARWRPLSTGPAGADEVVVRGERVLAPGGEAVLAVDEGLRYGAKAGGYHGGASLAEITVPIVVLDRTLQNVRGWRAAAPQTPVWWHEPVTAPVETTPAPPKRSARRRPTEDSLDLMLPGLSELAAEPEPRASLVERLLSAPGYAAQRARAGRRALGDDVVRAVLTALLDRGGRAHRETVAAAAGVAEANLEPTLAALRRLLNVDGYAVVGEDPDGVTVVLDEKLLAEQFELG